jgi:hypothetical protein
MIWRLEGCSGCGIEDAEYIQPFLNPVKRPEAGPSSVVVVGFENEQSSTTDRRSCFALWWDMRVGRGGAGLQPHKKGQKTRFTVPPDTEQNADWYNISN